ncbi:MAG: hypothetical protein ACR2LC_03205 [Pyrinomonadaceae bacterium]
MLLLKPCTGANLILRPQDRPAYYPAPTTEAAYVIVYWRVRRTDGTIDAWHEHDRVAPTAQTTIHHNPNEDQLIDVALMPYSASAVPGYATIEDAFAATAMLQRETGAPVIVQAGDATTDNAPVGVSGYTSFAIKRRVRKATALVNGQLSNPIEMIFDSSPDTVPPYVDIYKMAGDPSTIYVAVAHSSGTAWTPDSNIIMITFATASTTGGNPTGGSSGGDFDPLGRDKFQPGL